MLQLLDFKSLRQVACNEACHTAYSSLRFLAAPRPQTTSLNHSTPNSPESRMQCERQGFRRSAQSFVVGRSLHLNACNTIHNHTHHKHLKSGPYPPRAGPPPICTSVRCWLARTHPLGQQPQLDFQSSTKFSTETSFS